MIEFNNLSVGFENKTILSGLSGKITPGKLIALMGTNGAGKSCLIKALSGMNSAISGEIRIDGKIVTEHSKIEVAKNIGVVLTEKVHVDFLRVEEVLELGRSPYTGFWGALNDLDHEVIEEVALLLKIRSLQSRYFSDLSDGQKQKVLLARALIQRPKFLFLDEPTTYLDIPSKVDLMNMLKLICREKNMGILLSTHDLSLVSGMVDFIWLIDAEGKLYQKSPEEMHSSGLLKKNFNI